MPRRARSPNCTHMDMNRVWDHGQRCTVCGRRPPMGFLYECRQDHTNTFLLPVARDPLVAEDEPNAGQTSALRLKLEGVGLSESMIRNAEAGGYTEAQLNKLIAQKLQLKRVISEILQEQEEKDSLARLFAMSRAVSNNDGASYTSETAVPSCNVKICHTCRPYLRDRINMSIESVMSGDFPFVTYADIDRLPIRSAFVMRNIGLAPTTTESQNPTSATMSNSLSHSADPTSSSVRSSSATFRTTQSDINEITSLRQNHHRIYKLSRRRSSEILHNISQDPALFSRRGIKSAIQGIFRTSRASSSTGSNITLPVSRTGTARNLAESPGLEVRDFDVGALRRVRRQKERNDLRTGMYRGGFEGVEVESAAQRPLPEVPQKEAVMCKDEESNASDSDNLSLHSCVSEGSEVEVAGGVALTEEAVETHTPDILSVPISALSLTPASDSMPTLEKAQDYEETSDYGDDDVDDGGVSVHRVPSSYADAWDNIMTQP